MKRSSLSFIIGLLTGAVLVSGGATYAAGITARYNPQTVDLDGVNVQMEAYAIDGHNYVKLRDIGQAVGFNVYWADNTVHIDSDAPYTGKAPGKPETASNQDHNTQTNAPDGVTIAPDGTITSKVITQPAWSREDFSQQADPEIFTGSYTREWYNALRQTIVDQDIIAPGNNEDHLNPGYLYAHTLVPYTSKETSNAFSDLILRLCGTYDYQQGAEPYTKNQYEYHGYTIIKVYRAKVLEPALDYIQPMLASLNGKSDAEKVIYFNRYLCDRLDYGKGTDSGPTTIFSNRVGPMFGQCGSYTYAFKFLCGAADIPCVTVRSEDHAWNEVYVDGQWLTVDVTFNNASAGRDAYLLTKASPRTDIRPEGTRFTRELLVPGSTK